MKLTITKWVVKADNFRKIRKVELKIIKSIMKDQLRDPNTLELFPEVMDDLESILDVKNSKKTKKSETTNRFRTELIKELSSISKSLD